MKKAKPFLTIFPIIAFLFSICVSSGALIGVMAGFTYNLILNPSFAYDYAYTYGPENENNATAYLSCYPVTSGGPAEVANPVSVAWREPGEKENRLRHHTASTVKIPASFIKDGTTYNVVGIHEEGFQYCDFTTIELPNTIYEIEKGAFYLCQNLTSFTLPYHVAEISSSCFMDCRNLATFNYMDSSGVTTTTNDTITAIGDHAFTSCVKLEGFDCPSSIQSIGTSAFQNCGKISSFFFPNNRTSDPGISIGDYAFANCSDLTFCYFDTNVNSVGEYAFFRDTRLKIYYTGTKATFEAKEGVDTLWRRLYLPTERSTEVEKVPIEDESGIFDYDHTNTHPGIFFIIQNDIDLLMTDQAQAVSGMTDAKRKFFQTHKNVDVDKNDPVTLFGAGYKHAYACILKFEPPVYDPENPTKYSGYWEKVDGDFQLTIPDTVKSGDEIYPVRVIKEQAFKDHPEIQRLKFNSNLVQICHEAFIGCTGLKNLDFTSCNCLLEVSYSAFLKYDEADNSKGKQVDDSASENTAVQSLILPNSLKYIGYHAFANFKGVTSFHLPTSTVFIGDEAFVNLGSNIADGAGTVDLVIPNTIRDSMVNYADNFGFKPRRIFNAWDYAIGAWAFKNAKCLRTVTTDPVPEDRKDGKPDTSKLWGKVTSYNGTVKHDVPKGHNDLKPYRNSLQKGAFEGCTSLIRYVSNKLLYVIGRDAFQGCPNLKEIFLSTLGSCNANNGCPWGSNGKDVGIGNEVSIFGVDSSEATVAMPDAVIYVDDSNAPSDSQKGAPRSNKNRDQWHSDSRTFPNEFGSNFNLNRPCVPTYYSVLRSDVKYYDLNSESANYKKIVTSTDFSTPAIAFIDGGSDYTLTRCYPGTSGITSSLDMTTLENQANIKIVGAGCFAQMGTGALPGTSFTLPSALTTIRERAFYRQDNSEDSNTRGVQVINYKSGDPATVQTLSTTSTFYCNLPSTVKRVERLAFYNNRFEKVKLNGDMDFIGNSAFIAFPRTAKRTTITEIALGDTQTNFHMSGDTTGTTDDDYNGLYYDKAADSSTKKTLVYQLATISGALTVEDGTVAIGARACANTLYSSVTLPVSLTTIYGGAFQRSTAIQTVSFATGDPKLKYIGAPAYTDTEVWQNGLPFDVEDTTTGAASDDNFNSYFGAFFNCTSLATFDFLQIKDTLVKIGYGAFENCSSLANMVGTEEYSYYSWDATNNVPVLFRKENQATEEWPKSEGTSKGVLDLSDCPNLRGVGHCAFKNCTSIHYVHLPDSSSFYLSSREDEIGRGEPAAGVWDGCNAQVLIGETITKAHNNYATNTTDSRKRYSHGKNFKGNVKAYYKVNSSSDTNTGDTDTRYWCYLGDGGDGIGKKYLLFTNWKQAKDYFDAEHDIPQ